MLWVWNTEKFKSLFVENDAINFFYFLNKQLLTLNWIMIWITVERVLLWFGPTIHNTQAAFFEVTYNGQKTHVMPKFLPISLKNQKTNNKTSWLLCNQNRIFWSGWFWTNIFFQNEKKNSTFLLKFLQSFSSLLS